MVGVAIANADVTEEGEAGVLGHFVEFALAVLDVSGESASGASDEPSTIASERARNSSSSFRHYRYAIRRLLLRRSAATSRPSAAHTHLDLRMVRSHAIPRQSVRSRQALVHVDTETATQRRVGGEELQQSARCVEPRGS